jgi:hypothetical protein
MLLKQNKRRELFERANDQVTREGGLLDEQVVGNNKELMLGHLFEDLIKPFLRFSI